TRCRRGAGRAGLPVRADGRRSAWGGPSGRDPGRRGSAHYATARGAHRDRTRSRTRPPAVRSNGRIQLLLASASPARLATLRAAGVDPRVCVSGVDESGIDAGSPAETARELARLKCATVLRSTTNPL